MIKYFRPIKLSIVFTVLFFYCGFAQETNYKEYSYTEFFKLIEQETDTIFKLNNAVITFNPKTDARFRYDWTLERDSTFVPKNAIVVDKQIELSNVLFTYNYNSALDKYEGGFYDIHFKKRVYLENVPTTIIHYCKFDERFWYGVDDCSMDNSPLGQFRNFLSVEFSEFNRVYVFKSCTESNRIFHTYFNDNVFSNLSPGTYNVFVRLVGTNCSLDYQNNPITKEPAYTAFGYIAWDHISVRKKARNHH